MKRNIEVKEKQLIDKLNTAVNAKNGPVEYTGDGTETEIVKEAWDRDVHGEIVKQDELPEEQFKDTPEEAPASWDEHVPDCPADEVNVDLDPTKNMDYAELQRFHTSGPCSIQDIFRDSLADAKASRESNRKVTIPVDKAKEDIYYKKYLSNPANLRALKRALNRVHVEEEETRLRTPYVKPECKVIDKPYEEVNHPQHYNTYDVEVIDMMERVFGKEATATFCKLNAFKYRMRAGTKPGQSADKDLNKEQWYLKKMNELTQ